MHPDQTFKIDFADYFFSTFSRPCLCPVSGLPSDEKPPPFICFPCEYNPPVMSQPQTGVGSALYDCLNLTNHFQTHGRRDKSAIS